jgi:hypothetical protein
MDSLLFPNLLLIVEEFRFIYNLMNYSYTHNPLIRVVFEAKDTNSLYVVIALMMAMGIAMLLLHLRKLRVHQAVKLGEER